MEEVKSMAGFDPFAVIKRGLKVLRKEFSNNKNETPLSTQTIRSAKPNVLNQADSTKNVKAQKELHDTQNTMVDEQTQVTTPTPLSAHLMPATLLVLYLDEQQASLTDASVLHGYRGQEVELDIKRFRDYYVSQIEGYTSNFVERYGVIKVHYQRRKAAAVWLLAKDIDQQNLLAKPEFVHGKLNAPYSLVAPSFANYRLLQARGPVTGYFLERQQFVTYLYRQKLWQDVDESLRLLKVTDFIKCISEPHGQELKMTLAKNTLWQVYKSVRTTDGILWYCLGGNTWVKNSQHTQLMERKQYLNEVKQTQQVAKSYAVSLNVSAKIDFIPGKKVTLYDLPCGKKTAQLDDGQTVQLSAHKNINGMQWYHVTDVGWLLAEYLKFK